MVLNLAAEGIRQSGIAAKARADTEILTRSKTGAECFGWGLPITRALGPSAPGELMLEFLRATDLTCHPGGTVTLQAPVMIIKKAPITGSIRRTMQAPRR